MRTIIIKNHDAATVDAIAAAIHDAEGRATARTITPENVFFTLAVIEEKFNIPKKYLDGVAVNVDYNAQEFPAAYNGIPQSTHFKAVYKRGTWRITAIYRADTRRTSQAIRTEIPEAARAALIAKYAEFTRNGF